MSAAIDGSTRSVPPEQSMSAALSVSSPTAERTIASAVLGDVVVCPAVAARQAPDHAGNLDDELAEGGVVFWVPHVDTVIMTVISVNIGRSTGEEKPWWTAPTTAESEERRCDHSMGGTTTTASM